MAGPEDRPLDSLLRQAHCSAAGGQSQREDSLGTDRWQSWVRTSPHAGFPVDLETPTGMPKSYPGQLNLFRGRSLRTLLLLGHWELRSTVPGSGKRKKWRTNPPLGFEPLWQRLEGRDHFGMLRAHSSPPLHPHGLAPHWAKAPCPASNRGLTW